MIPCCYVEDGFSDITSTLYCIDFSYLQSLSMSPVEPPPDRFFIFFMFTLPTTPKSSWGWRRDGTQDRELVVAGKGKKREKKRSGGEEFFGGERKEGRGGGVLERKEETERGGNGSGERLDCLRE